MKSMPFVVMGCIWWSLLGAAAVHGADARMTRGFYEGVKNARMLVTTPNGGKEYFDVTGGTKFVNPGRPGDISRLPRHSIVQVISKEGAAVEIVVVEVSK